MFAVDKLSGLKTHYTPGSFLYDILDVFIRQFEKKRKKPDFYAFPRYPEVIILPGAIRCLIEERRVGITLSCDGTLAEIVFFFFVRVHDAREGFRLLYSNSSLYFSIYIYIYIVRRAEMRRKASNRTDEPFVLLSYYNVRSLLKIYLSRYLVRAMCFLSVLSGALRILLMRV